MVVDARCRGALSEGVKTRNAPPAASTAVQPASPLKRIRLRRKLKQERLAVLSGFSLTWVGYLERNPEKMTAPAASRLAAALNCKPEELKPCRP